MRANSLSARHAAGVCLSLLVACASPIERAPAPHRNPVVRIRFRGERLSADRRYREVHVASGSGFLVSARGHVVTSHHVVHRLGYPPASLTVTVDPDTEREAVYGARVVAFDRAADLALIAMEGAPGPLPLLRLGDAEQLRAGARVRVQGYPHGGAFVEERGQLTAHLPGDDTGMVKAAVESEALAEIGNSGGPLLSEQGDVLGVVRSRRYGPGSIILAVPVDYLRRRLRQWGVLEGATAWRPASQRSG